MSTVAVKQSVNEAIDYELLKQKFFPIIDHPLYGSVQNFDQVPYLLPERLADFTNDTDFEEGTTSLEICPACFFNTSGTTNRSKKIPFSDADLERQKLHEAIALRKLGMGAGDGVLSLGAPLPSISGWAIINGSESTGAYALNTSQLDYDTVFDQNKGDKVTFVIGTPLVVKEIGMAITEEYGAMKDVAPNIKTGIIFGDVLPDALRAELKEIWGFNHVYSLYGTVEADVVATECVDKQGEMNLMSERLYFEFLPESEMAKERKDPNYIAKSMPIINVADSSFGEIIISDLSRDTLPLIRYRIGDIVKIHRATGVEHTEKLTISVLGRSKNTVMLDGIALYEMQLNNALKTWLSDDLIEWKLIENEIGLAHRYHLFLKLKQGIKLSLDDSEKFHNALREQRNELSVVDLEKEILVEQVAEFEKVEIKGDTKAQRIILLPIGQ